MSVEVKLEALVDASYSGHFSKLGELDIKPNMMMWLDKTLSSYEEEVARFEKLKNELVQKCTKDDGTVDKNGEEYKTFIIDIKELLETTKLTIDITPISKVLFLNSINTSVNREFIKALDSIGLFISEEVKG